MRPASNKSSPKPASISIPTEPIGSIPRQLDLIERVAKGSVDPNLAPSMKMRFEIPEREHRSDNTVYPSTGQPGVNRKSAEMRDRTCRNVISQDTPGKREGRA